MLKPMVVALSISLLAADVRAQRLECGESIEGSIDREGFTLKSVTAKEGARFKNPVKLRFTDFDRKYGIERIDVTAENLNVEKNEEIGNWVEYEQHVIFRVQRAGGRTDFYKLVDKGSDALAVSSNVNEEATPPDPVDITLAAVKSEPVFKVSTIHRSQGANSAFATTNAYIIDFGTAAPRTLNFVCEDSMIGGYHAIDAAAQMSSTVFCEWNQETRDFHCTRRTDTNSGITRWAYRSMTFYSNESLWPPIDKFDVVWDLEEAAAELKKQPRKDLVVAAGIGWLSRLALEGRNDIIYVAEGTGELPTLRFFLFDPSGPLLTELTTDEISDGIEQQTPDNEEFTHTWTDSVVNEVGEDGSTPLPVDRTISAKRIYRNASVSIYEVFFRRDVETDEARSIYWLAVPHDEKDDPRALMIAADGENVLQQNTVERPASVSQVNIDSRAKEFTATVVVEPRAWYDYNDETHYSVRDCASSITIRWKGAAFEATPKRDCVSPRRIVRIDRNGAIKAVDPAQAKF